MGLFKLLFDYAMKPIKEEEEKNIQEEAMRLTNNSMLESRLHDYKEYLFDDPENALHTLQELARILNELSFGKKIVSENQEYSMHIRKSSEFEWFSITDYFPKDSGDSTSNTLGELLYPFFIVKNQSNNSPENGLNKLYEIGKTLNEIRNGESVEITLYRVAARHTFTKKFTIIKPRGSNFIELRKIDTRKSYNF